MKRNTSRTNVFSRIYSPVKHAIMATKESISAVTNTAKGVSCNSLSGLDRIGSSVAKHTNMAVNDLMGKRRTRKNRSMRKNTRKVKKSTK